MSFASVWRSWRVKVQNILEVGGEAHPIGHAVNNFLVILIIANGLAFATATVYAGSSGLQRLLGDRLRCRSVSPLLTRLPALAGAADRDATDDDHRPARVLAPVRPQDPSLRLPRLAPCSQLFRLPRTSSALRPALQTLKRVVAHRMARAARRAFADDDAARICLHHHLLPGAQRAARAFRQRPGFGLVDA